MKLIASFAMVTALVWAAVLFLHGPGPVNGAYEDLQDETTRFVAVHMASIVLLGLLGLALFLLVRDLPGRAAQVCRWAIAPFVLFYATGEAIVGVATGLVVNEAVDAPAGERAGIADAAQALYDSIPGELLLGAGSVAGVVAIVAAAVAIQRAGAPLAATVLMGLSALVVWHVPPIGPFALACFAAAVGLFAFRRPAPRTAPAELDQPVELSSPSV